MDKILIVYYNDELRTHLGWPSGISLGSGSVLLLEVSGSIPSGANLGGLVYLQKKIMMNSGDSEALSIIAYFQNKHQIIFQSSCIIYKNEKNTQNILFILICRR